MLWFKNSVYIRPSIHKFQNVARNNSYTFFRRQSKLKFENFTLPDFETQMTVYKTEMGEKLRKELIVSPRIFKRTRNSNFRDLLRRIPIKLCPFKDSWNHYQLFAQFFSHLGLIDSHLLFKICACKIFELNL